jgi:hypothetical protein
MAKWMGSGDADEFGIAISMMKPFKTKREAEFACTNYVCIWLNVLCDGGSVTEGYQFTADDPDDQPDEAIEALVERTEQAAAASVPPEVGSEARPREEWLRGEDDPPPRRSRRARRRWSCTRRRQARAGCSLPTCNRS